MELKALNFDRYRHWVSDARGKLESDPVHSFISGWIAFNHYYGTYAVEYRESLLKWTNDRKPRDKKQWLFLMQREDFQHYFEGFKKREPDVLDTQLALPVESILHRTLVPEGLKPGSYRLADLSALQIFESLYQIRNNLFHGSKDPGRSERDLGLATSAATFMASFLEDLRLNTSGEVHDAYDPDVLSKYPKRF